MDPARGEEPFVRGDEDDPCVVVFNGELLNHREIRSELIREGAVFHTDCDAETAAEAVARRGPAAIDAFHGMFAIAWYRPRRRELLLARDPFGVVPLLHATLPDGRIAVASEMAPMVELLGSHARIDAATLSGYLASIRITVGDRTLVRDVHVVRPGHLVRIDLSEDRARIRSDAWWNPPAVTGDLEGPEADAALATAVEASLEAHLQSDVEVCTLLSGGIDSAILSTLAADRIRPLRCFTAVGGDEAGDPDRAAATLMADRLGVERIEVDPTSGRTIGDRWRGMVRALAVPLGTPNEIAIQALAEGVHRAGVKVAISGEGADELLGGYEPVLQVASAIAATRPSLEAAASALVETIAWIPPSRQGRVLSSACESIAHERLLAEETADALAAGGGPDSLRAYFTWLQRVNLAGLLGRLNHAAMISSVEARPPFADRRLAETVARIATRDLFRPDEPGATKLALRRAFAARLPAEIATRPKASFPTPFATWAADMLAESDVRDALAPLVGADVLPTPTSPGDPNPDPSTGMTAWPLANLGVWSVETGVPLLPA